MRLVYHQGPATEAIQQSSQHSRFGCVQVQNVRPELFDDLDQRTGRLDISPRQGIPPHLTLEALDSIRAECGELAEKSFIRPSP
jgi:hypothetical protein